MSRSSTGVLALAAILLAACAADPSGSQIDPPRLEATVTSIIDAAPTTLPTADPTPRLTDTPNAISPLPDNCIAYIFRGRKESNSLVESGIYLSCPEQNFHEAVELFEITNGFTNFSPDHLAPQKSESDLIFTARDDVHGTWRVFSFDIANSVQTELLSSEEITRHAISSADGEYFAYILVDSATLETSIVTYHISSKTYSTAFSSAQGLSILTFDWSPDADHLVIEVSDGNQDTKILVVDISCDETLFICRTSNEYALDNVLYEPTWASDTLIISSTGYPHSEIESIRLTDMVDNIVEEIVISEIDSDVYNIHSASLSPDGERIVFFGVKPGQRCIFVLGRDSYELTSIIEDSRDVLYENPIWVP